MKAHYLALTMFKEDLSFEIFYYLLHSNFFRYFKELTNLIEWLR